MILYQMVCASGISEAGDDPRECNIVEDMRHGIETLMRKNSRGCGR